MTYNITIEMTHDLRRTLRPATVHETMGPNYKTIYWFNSQPYVSKTDKPRRKASSVMQILCERKVK